MATVEQLTQALAAVHRQHGEVQRLAAEAQRAGVPMTGQVDPRVMNKCPTFSGRDTWSEWSFIFESVAAMANFEPVMESAFTGSAEKPIADLTPEIQLGAKQLYYLLVNTVRGKALTLVRSAEKHLGTAAWKRIKTEYQPDAAGRHTAMLMGIMQPGWDSRSAANFLDQLTGWERRIQEYEGESLETFSDGMKIAVLASSAPESIRNVVRLAGRTSEWELSSGAPEHVSVSCSLAESWTRMVEEWSRSPAVHVQSQWPLMLSAGAKERDASCADVPATQRKTTSSIKPRARPRIRVRRRTPRLTRTVPPCMKASVATVARTVTSGQTAGSVWQKRRTRKSTPLMERRRLQP